MRLYIIRHGDPDYDRDDLTPLGMAEAEALAAYVPKWGLTHLYMSPMGRAQSTCRACAQKLGLAPVTLDWACELDTNHCEVPGLGTFLPFTIPGEASYALSPTPRYKGWQRQAYFDHPEFVKRVRAMEKGADALFAAHGYTREGRLYRVTRPSTDRVALFCHQGLGTTLIAYLLNIPYQAAWTGLWQACTGVTTLTTECYDGGQFAAPRMIGMGETPHIDLKNLPRSERGLVQKEC